MFANVVQPGIVSLFSSAGSAPLQLFSQHVDPAPVLRSDSLIHLLNDTTNLPPPPEPGVLVQSSFTSRSSEKDDNEKADSDTQRVGRTLCQTVLHIQSPTLRTTYIRCPPHRSSSSPFKTPVELGLTLPWMHMQVCRLGEREWVFEVGVADRAGRKGVIRCSTFQKEATVVMHHDPPLLHVPLHFPEASARPFTAWSSISIDLASLIQQFHLISSSQRAEYESFAHTQDEGHENDVPNERIAREHSGMNAPLPSGGLGKVTYVKVYANCRLRRIWLSDNKRGALPWEFELYASP
ncbi:hypothetical protein ACEPAF_1486 [Sanghuangporus sanghuang]